MFPGIRAITAFYISFHTIAALLGCLFNSVVIYLALFRSPRAIATYTTLLINVAVVDFFACFTDFFIQQRHIPAGFTLAYTSHGMCTYFGPHFCFLMYSINIHFVAHGLWSLLLGFAYRYYILFNPAPTRKILIFVILVIYIPSFAQLFIFLWADDDPAEIKRILMDRFPSYDLQNETVSGTIDIISFPALYTIIHMTCPITPVYMTIILLRKKIINKLMSDSIDMTPKTKQLHAQLLRALTYQALIPCFYSMSIASYVMGQFFYSHPIFEYTTLSGFLFMPLLSPISSIVFIKIYNRTVLTWIYRLIGKEIPQEWASVMNLTNTKAGGRTSIVPSSEVKSKY